MTLMLTGESPRFSSRAPLRRTKSAPAVLPSGSKAKTPAPTTKGLEDFSSSTGFHLDRRESAKTEVHTESSLFSTMIKSKTKELPTKDQIKKAKLVPYDPGNEGWKREKQTPIGWSGVDECMKSRSTTSSSTKNSSGIFLTEIDGRDYFVKQVDVGVARREQLHYELAQAAGLGERALPAKSFVPDPKSGKAFLITPFLEGSTEGVDPKGLVKAFGGQDKALEEMTKLALFDYFTRQTDRCTPRNYMFDPRSVVKMIDNDDALQGGGKSFEARTSSHYIQVFVEELTGDGQGFKKLEIPKPFVRRLIENVESRLEPMTSKVPEGGDLKAYLQEALEVLNKLILLDRPTLGDLCEGSKFMDKLQYE